MNIKPLKHNVLIERDSAEDVTASGIIIARTKRREEMDKPMCGKVLALGSKVEGIAVGDTVHFQNYSVTEVDNVKKIIIVSDEKIICAY